MLTDREKFISIVDNDLLVKSDAIILLEGDGFNRYRHVAELYSYGWAPKIIFSGGITDYKYGSFPFSDIRGKLIDTGVREEDILHEGRSLNTKEQANEVLRIVSELKWNKLILVASCEHQYRAYLTFLRNILDQKNGILLFNSSVHLSWFEDCDWGIRYDRIDQEFERIEKYSSLGHLATFKEAIEYQKWKEQTISRE